MRKIRICICCTMMLLLMNGCSSAKKKEDVKIGVSLGVGEAIRWQQEKAYMEERAEELGIQTEIRLNKTDTPLTQTEDCKEMIDAGIDVLILTPRDANHVEEILNYANEHDVKVISYARVVLGQKVDLFVGYDSTKIGQMMGQYLVEMVYEGDYIILSGSLGDNNSTLIYNGAMIKINEIQDQVNIILDEPVPNWSQAEAKEMVKTAVSKNNNHVDAILAPNDKVAEACVDALAELGLKDSVIITGMDAEVAALQRIVAGTQSMTVYMDLDELATSAIDEAFALAMGEEASVNAQFDNQSGSPIDAKLISGKLITKQNLDSILIDSGYISREEVYGTSK